MKLLLYVLSALLLLSSVRTEDTSQKQDYDVSKIEDDAEARNALKEGINWVYSKAAEKYQIVEIDIKITKVIKVQKWVEKGKNCYSFDVQAENSDCSITSTYNVKCSGDGKYKVMDDWTYDYEMKGDDKKSGSDSGNEVDDDNYDADKSEKTPDYQSNVYLDYDKKKCEKGTTEVHSSKIKTDSQLKDALTYGLSLIFEKAQEKYSISDHEITVKVVELICTWKDHKDGSIYWYFDVEAINTDHVIIETTFHVKLEKGSYSKEYRLVNGWSYDIQYYGDSYKPDTEDSYPDKSEDKNVDTYQDEDEYEEKIDVEVEIAVDVYDDYSDDKDYGKR